MLADSGAIGGSLTHEFVVLADCGEAIIVYCANCDYAANVEKGRMSTLASGGRRAHALGEGLDPPARRLSNR